MDTTGNITADMALGLLEQGIFSDEEIRGRRVLVVGGMIWDYPLGAMVVEHFKQHGAVLVKLLHYYYQQRADFSDFFQQRLAGETFDLIFFIEGLEKAWDPRLAAMSVKRACAPDGRILLMARAPLDTGTRFNIHFCEDNWRYTGKDICALFPEYKPLRMVETTPPYFSAAKLQKVAEDVLALGDDIAIYHCRVGRPVTFGESRELGYFRSFSELTDLGNLMVTDKGLLFHNYLDKYEFFLKPFKERAFTLLELGVFMGASEDLWEAYFPHAEIHGVDIDPECKQYEKGRIHIHIMDLAKKENLMELRALRPLVIIDDASHLWSHQILALFTLFDVLPSGGVYILEDMETALNQRLYPGYNDAEIDAYTVSERIVRVAASKEPETRAPYAEEITRIGMATELAAIMKGSAIFIKR